MNLKENKKRIFDDEFFKNTIFSVSEFLDYINKLIGIKKISVLGEVTGAKSHPTGFYFSLKDKDDGSLMDCYMSPFLYRNLGVIIEDGMEIKVRGTPSIYKARGRFSFRVETLELSGEGSLKKAYELLKKKLQEEGLFTRKRKLPEFISNIGIITSKTGAVIGDFRKNLLPLGIKLNLYDSRVEGLQAVSTIVDGIKWFNKNMPELDVLVIIRGGGSLEDLQAFNNELVARAIFSSSIPTICGIGHDRDVPIASLIGDEMTSTPSMSAVIINDSWERLVKQLPILETTILNSFENTLNQNKNEIKIIYSKIISAFKNIFTNLQNAEKNILKGTKLIELKIIDIKKEIEKSKKEFIEKFSISIQNIKNKISKSSAVISAMNPERNLKLGYSIVKNSRGKIIRNIKEVMSGDIVNTYTGGGEFTSEVCDVKLNKYDK